MTSAAASGDRAGGGGAASRRARRRDQAARRRRAHSRPGRDLAGGARGGGWGAGLGPLGPGRPRPPGAADARSGRRRFVSGVDNKGAAGRPEPVSAARGAQGAGRAGGALREAAGGLRAGVAEAPGSPPPRVAGALGSSLLTGGGLWAPDARGVPGVAASVCHRASGCASPEPGPSAWPWCECVSPGAASSVSLRPGDCVAWVCPCVCERPPNLGLLSVCESLLVSFECECECECE